MVVSQGLAAIPLDKTAFTSSAGISLYTHNTYEKRVSVWREVGGSGFRPTGKVDKVGWDYLLTDLSIVAALHDVTDCSRGS